MTDAKCWHCESNEIRFLADGWICTICGQHGEEKTPAKSSREGLERNSPYLDYEELDYKYEERP